METPRESRACTTCGRELPNGMRRCRVCDASESLDTSAYRHRLAGAVLMVLGAGGVTLAFTMNTSIGDVINLGLQAVQSLVMSSGGVALVVGAVIYAAGELQSSVARAMAALR